MNWQNELAGYYRDADVALVTPMRDGMNLVAKEFVACKGNSFYNFYFEIPISKTLEMIFAIR